MVDRQNDELECHVFHVDQVFNAEILNKELTDTLRRLLESVVVAYQEFSKERPK